MRYCRDRFATLLIATLLPTSQAFADGLGYINQNIIDGQALSEVRGVVAVNTVAGDHNAQSNAVAIAINPTGSALADVTAWQGGTRGPGKAPSQSMAVIGGQAFTNASGLITVNQASGEENLQSNNIAIAIGIEGEALADSTLAQTLPEVQTLGPQSPSSQGERKVVVADTAFQGASGIVQLNQSAGSGNATANNFALYIRLEDQKL